ncbi:hypothetical protein C4J83_4853 [Pseudomonas sp. LBUM920]|nr:hypothetical protein C4J83_4853 [Pseudomonas sp. LBUM920]
MCSHIERWALACREEASSHKRISAHHPKIISNFPLKNILKPF